MRTAFRTVLCTVESDSHMWNLVYLQKLLEEHGADVDNLGQCTPVADVVRAVRLGKPDLLVLSSVNGHGFHGARTLRTALLDAGLDVPAVAGGKLTTSESDNDRVRRELLAAGWSEVFTGDRAIPQFLTFLHAGLTHGFGWWQPEPALVAPWDAAYATVGGTLMHIVIVNRWPRFDDGIRWDNELTRYEDFIDHTRHRVSYVVDGPGSHGVLADAGQIAHLVQVDDVNDVDLLRSAVAEITAVVGPVDQLIALSEFTLEIAAQVREDLGIPGPTVAEVATYRDKVRMKEILAEASIPVPRFAACTGVGSGLAFARTTGYPVIVKPVDGAASIGVHRVDDERGLAELLATLDLSRHEIEEFIQGSILHVDGFADAAGGLPFQVVSRYVNDCLAFGSGAPLGSVVLQRSALRERVESFSRRCVAALGLRSTPFHLELFLTPGDELVFLEIGGRVGGSEVPHLLYRLFGVNLFEAWIRCLTGEDVALLTKQADPSGGWLVVPKPDQRVRVDRVTSMAGLIPSLWRELLPRPGDVLEPGGAYDALHSGRFILVHDDEATVEADIRNIIRDFEFEGTPA